MDFCCYNSSKISTKSFRTRYTFCTECVDSAILLPLTVINTNITMVISKNQLLLRDTQKHCNFWACNTFIDVTEYSVLFGYIAFCGPQIVSDCIVEKHATFYPTESNEYHFFVRPVIGHLIGEGALITMTMNFTHDSNNPGNKTSSSVRQSQ